jgi:hypothetical protein
MLQQPRADIWYHLFYMKRRSTLARSDSIIYLDKIAVLTSGV